MPITPKNLVRHELIGLRVRISKSKDPTQKGVKGIVVDETYKTLKIKCGNRIKTIPKEISVFVFTLPNNIKVEVDGKILLGRPEDRIKKRFERW